MHSPKNDVWFFARRFGRIVKQYEDAIKRCKAGKPVPFDELPTPPGFGPIPGVVQVCVFVYCTDDALLFDVYLGGCN